MNYILFDGTVRNSLLPLTFTRPVAELRIGILTIREKWEQHLGFTTTTLTEDYLEEKYPMVEMEHNVMINASFLPTKLLADAIAELTENQAIFINGEVVAFFTNETQDEVNFDSYEIIEFKNDVIQIKNTWDLFSLNDKALKDDFELITEGRKSQPIPNGVQYLNKENIFIEEGAEILFSTLNASTGPIYIGKHVNIQIGTLIQGPAAILDHSVTNLGSKIRPYTTIAPHCKVGGEISNSIFYPFSNKGHDGNAGSSIIGSFCNWGAMTCTSNVKNDLNEVDIFDYSTAKPRKTNTKSLGVIMGDFVTTGIGTRFNTGTVVGNHSNISGIQFSF